MEIGKWINVKDRLPNNVTPVIVYSECCGSYYIDIAEIEDGKWFKTNSGEDLEIEPIYWMLLKLPKNKN